jgi:phasin
MASPPRKTARTGTVTIDPVDVTVVVDAVLEPVREIEENVRKAADEGVQEASAAYARVEAYAGDAKDSMATSYSLASKGIIEFNTKALEAARANTEAAFELARALFGVKSLSEAITLQTEHARKQYEAMTFQIKELTALAQRMMAESSEPIKASVSKTLSAAS